MASEARSVTRFVVLSGLGWLLDTCIYLLLVAFLVPVFIASIAGGLSGASFAFLTSSRFVFSAQGHGLPIKLIVYLAYSALLILLAAVAAHLLTELLLGLGELLRVGQDTTIAAFLAKCAITPFLLALNFLVARTLLRPRSADD